jgi:hypothetical protein
MTHPVSGYVWRFEGKRRPVRSAKYRLLASCQVKKTIVRFGPPAAARR